MFQGQSALGATERAAQEAAKTAALGDGPIFAAAPPPQPGRAGNGNVAVGQALRLVDGPGRDQMLSTALPNAVLVAWLEVGHLDGKAASDHVEQDLADAQSLFRCGCSQSLMSCGPHRFVGTDFIQVQIVDSEQVALLKIGRVDAPAAPQIMIDAVAQHIA